MKKYILIALVTVLSIGCKKENSLRIASQDELAGTWLIDSIWGNNRMYYPVDTVFIYDDGRYFADRWHVYEIEGNQIKLDHGYLFDFILTGNYLKINAYVENPVNAFGSETYMTRI